MMKKYIEWLNSTEYQVCVGQYGQESFFQKNDGQKLITAQRGEDGHGTRPVGTGGNGYSGGGVRTRIKQQRRRKYQGRL